MSKGVKIALWLAAPWVGLIVATILFAIIGSMAGSTDAASTAASSAELFQETPTWQRVANTSIFLLAAASLLLMPVSVIMAIRIGSRKP